MKTKECILVLQYGFFFCGVVFCVEKVFLYIHIYCFSGRKRSKKRGGQTTMWLKLNPQISEKISYRGKTLNSVLLNHRQIRLPIKMFTITRKFKFPIFGNKNLELILKRFYEKLGYLQTFNFSKN